MQRFATCLGAVVLSIVGLLPIEAAALSPSKVLVVYPTNGADKNSDGENDSKQLADHYIRKRRIPAANVLGVNVSVLRLGYYYGNEYSKFYNELVAPIKTRLEKLGPTNIDVILLVGEIPKETRNASGGAIAVDNTLMMLHSLDPKQNTISAVANPYFEPNPSFGSDRGHFDHSLYKHRLTQDIYMVARISRMEQVDHALYAERFLLPETGYYTGNVYVDSSYGQGGSGNVRPYTDTYLRGQPAVQRGNYGGNEAEADMNIASAALHVASSGFPLKWENTTNGLLIGRAGATFSDGTPALRADRALFYAGWYNYQNYNDVWEWLPGSVACDFNSGSTFGMEALAHGASAASYVLGEPYRTGHQRPNILLHYILRGYSYAEASTLATPTMGWMAINEGDPLYTPAAPLMMVATTDKPRVPIKDTYAPALKRGYPVVTPGAEPNDWVVQLEIEEGPEPELVVAQVEFGTDGKLSQRAKSVAGYTMRPAVVLKGLQNDTVYQYRVTVTDPVGNSTVTENFTFRTGNRRR